VTDLSGFKNTNYSLCADTFCHCACGGSGEYRSKNRIRHSAWTEHVLQGSGLWLAAGPSSRCALKHRQGFWEAITRVREEAAGDRDRTTGARPHADINRPLTYAQMADDTAKLLRQLKIETQTSSATAWAVVSRSNLRYAILLWFASPSGPAASVATWVVFVPRSSKALHRCARKDFAVTPWQNAYAGVAPNPQDWPQLVATVK